MENVKVLVLRKKGTGIRSKLALVKAIKDVTMFGLKEAKDMVDSLPYDDVSVPLINVDVSIISHLKQILLDEGIDYDDRTRSKRMNNVFATMNNAPTEEQIVEYLNLLFHVTAFSSELKTRVIVNHFVPLNNEDDLFTFSGMGYGKVFSRKLPYDTLTEYEVNHIPFLEFQML